MGILDRIESTLTASLVITMVIIAELGPFALFAYTIYLNITRV